MKFGEIDANQILLNEWRIGILENILDLILQKNPNLRVTNEEMENVTKKVVENLQKKYPNSGIQLNKKVNTNE